MSDTSSGRDNGPHTLAIDIGGTGLKASVLDRHGRMIVDHVRRPTPPNCRPKRMLRELERLATRLPVFDRIAVGFPGVIKRGRVMTAPHFGTKVWRGFPLQDRIAELFDKPTRLENDAEVQGLGMITGHGLEVALTLGTGVGSAVFMNGRATPQIELAHHPIAKSMTYNDYVGNEALKRHGRRKWTRRVLKMIGIVDTLFNYDTLYLGGGNAQHIAAKLPPHVKIESNDLGITGGIRLWDDKVWGERQSS